MFCSIRFCNNMKESQYKPELLQIFIIIQNPLNIHSFLSQFVYYTDNFETSSRLTVIHFNFPQKEHPSHLDKQKEKKPSSLPPPSSLSIKLLRHYFTSHTPCYFPSSFPYSPTACLSVSLSTIHLTVLPHSSSSEYLYNFNYFATLPKLLIFYERQ